MMTVAGLALLLPSLAYLTDLLIDEIDYYTHKDLYQLPGCYIEIPKIDLIAPINTVSPNYGVYYDIDTPPPGRPGVTVFFGHRTMFGSPFYRLNELKPGDKVIVHWFGNTYVYVVYAKEVVSPSYKIPTRSKRDELWLVTCTPPTTSEYRLIVKCYRVAAEVV